jgi:hypothetical protein
MPSTFPPSHVELVTGPEAERLILAVHRWLTEQAQNLTLEEFVRRGNGTRGLKGQMTDLSNIVPLNE